MKVATIAKNRRLQLKDVTKNDVFGKQENFSRRSHMCRCWSFVVDSPSNLIFNASVLLPTHTHICKVLQLFDIRSVIIRGQEKLSGLFYLHGNIAQPDALMKSTKLCPIASSIKIIRLNFQFLARFIFNKEFVESEENEPKHLNTVFVLEHFI